MWKRIVEMGCAVCVAGIFLAPVTAQEKEGLGERIGAKIDRGLRQLGNELSAEWTEFRQSVERMGVQGRVYTRLRWDKAIDVSTLEVDMQDKDTVVLRGTLPSTEKQRKAVQLAQDTVGVADVIDQTTVTNP